MFTFCKRSWSCCRNRVPKLEKCGSWIRKKNVDQGPSWRQILCSCEQKIDIIDVMPSCQVPLRNDGYTLHKILTNNENLLVSLMIAKKMPDSNYEMIGELDKEIKEVIEWPVKHPELFWSTGHSTTEVNVSAWTPRDWKDIVALHCDSLYGLFL